MKRSKYRNFPPRINVAVGERCLLSQCSRQIRKVQVKKFGKDIPPAGLYELGLVLTGVNNLTGEKESFEIVQVNWYLFVGPKQYNAVVVERIK